MTPDGWHSLRLSRPLFLGFVSQQSATMRVSHSARFEAVTRLKNLLHIVVAVQAKRNMLRFQKGNLEFRNSLGFRRVRFTPTPTRQVDSSTQSSGSAFGETAQSAAPASTSPKTGLRETK